MQNWIKFIPGLFIVSLLAGCAVMLSQWLNISAGLLSILLGFVIGNVIILPEQCNKGIKWSECQALSVAVALLGAQLNVSALSEINGMILILILATILLTFVFTLLIAKLVKLDQSVAYLVASGQGICGSAAVMSAQKIIQAPPSQAGMVVALINFLGFVGVFLTVWLGFQFFPEKINESGILVGNTLQSMGHVVAAGFSLNDQSGQTAVLIKMCRILMLIPVLLILIILTRKSHHKNSTSEKIHWLKLIPFFIWVFLLLSFASSIQWIPENVKWLLDQTSDLLFLLAMVAIGLAIRLKDLYAQAGKLVLVGSLVFLIQLIFSVSFILNS